MADSVLDAATDPALENKYGLAGPFWIDEIEGAWAYIDSNLDVAAKKTTDGSATLSGKSTAEAATAMRLAAWFDRQGVGDTGTKIHTVQPDDSANVLRYQAYDISAGTWSSPVTVGSIAVPTNNSNSFSFIVKTRSGNLLAGCVVSGTASGAWKSTDGGANWNAIANPFESNAGDLTIGIYCDTDDDNDGAIAFLDVSTDEITVKVYDDSGDMWNESNAITGVAENNTERNWDASTILSNGQVFLAAWNGRGAAGGDLRTWLLNVNSSAAAQTFHTAKTDVLTDTAAAGCCSVFVNQRTNAIRVTYATGTWDTTLTATYNESTDLGTSWDSPVAVQEDAAGQTRYVAPTAMSAAAGRFQPAWWKDDTDDVYYNLNTDQEISGPVEVNLAGNQPAATGALAALQTLSRSLAGNQPSASGSLGGQYQIALAGAQPSGSGALTLRYAVTLSGNQPAATGVTVAVSWTAFGVITRLFNAADVG